MDEEVLIKKLKADEKQAEQGYSFQEFVDVPKKEGGHSLMGRLRRIIYSLEGLVEVAAKHALEDEAIRLSSLPPLPKPDISKVYK